MHTIPIHPPATTTPVQEHVALCRAYGAVQERCSRVMAQQQAQVARLEREVLRLRAAVMVRDTALAVERERFAALSAQFRAAASQHVPVRMRVWQWLRPGPGRNASAPSAATGPRRAQLAAADLLVGQGGWLSPGVDWPG
ncbi:hypothetical protein [Simplicispira suum]|uniref:hypothetical protein n=1 Tax=Simplicispira suum TaxID=2109915 RepID=UPI0014744EE4|nr:hypothetical protein [Simplicispira suum]